MIDNIPAGDTIAVPGATVRPLTEAKKFGAVVQSSDKSSDLVAFAKGSQDLVRKLLMEYGAVLFRGFDVRETRQFENVVRAIGGESLEYKERTSPRHRVSGNVYTSTDYPPEQSIFPHNENSYSITFPMKLFFCCLIPAKKGGETPIIDVRSVFRRIDPEIRQRFIDRKWMYVRNFGKGFGLEWQTVFQTDDREAVEDYCRHGRIEFEWKPENGLRTWQVRPCVARHPLTGDPVWFNHATFFHVSTLPASVREFLQGEFGDGELPNNTYYGDGSPIEPEVLDHLRQVYHEETVMFPWERGDVMVVDNLLAGHAREPFVGPRKVVVGMAEPISWDDVQWSPNA